MDSANQALLDTAPAPVAESPLVQPKPWKLEPATPEITRQERLISAAYLAMTALIVAFLVVTGLVAALTA